MQLFFNDDLKIISKLKLLGQIHDDDFDLIGKVSATITDNFIIVPRFISPYKNSGSFSGLHIGDKILKIDYFVNLLSDESMCSRVADNILKLTINNDLYFIYLDGNKVSGIMSFNKCLANYVSSFNRRVSLLSEEDKDIEIILPDVLSNIKGKREIKL